MTILSLNKRKLKASALQGVLTVSIVIVSIMVFLIFFSLNTSTVVSKQQRLDRLHRNVTSAMILLNSPQTAFSEGEVIDLYGNERDSVHIKKMEWGIYEVHLADAFYLNDTIRQAAIIGRHLSSADRFALYVADKHLPLSFSGASYVEGDAYLSDAGVRKTNIEGQEFKGTQVVKGQIKVSQLTMPELDSVYLRTLGEKLNKAPHVNYHGLVDSLRHSFDKPTHHIFLDGIPELENVILRGNIVLHSDEPLIIHPTAVLEDVLIFAPSIVFKNGVHGTVQAFARDSIKVSKDVILKYPSALGLFSPGDDQEDVVTSPFIALDSASKVSGIVFTSVSPTIKIIPQVQLKSGSEIEGQVYSTGFLELQGSIIGSAATNGFILKTPSTLYENFILNGTISVKMLSEYYRGSRVFNQKGVPEVIKWVN